MVREKIKLLSTLEEFRAEIADNYPCRLCKDYLPDLSFVTLFEYVFFSEKVCLRKSKFSLS